MNENGITWEELRRETLTAVFHFGVAERTEELIRRRDVSPRRSKVLDVQVMAAEANCCKRLWDGRKMWVAQAWSQGGGPLRLAQSN